MKVDVIVVGAGPSGGLTAKLIAERGYDVLLLEEHNELGRPFQCAGLVSHRVFELVDARDTVLNKLKRADIHTPGGRQVSIAANRDMAYVIDRVRFDKGITIAALDAGAELSLGSRLVGLKRDKKNKQMIVAYRKHGEKCIATAPLLVGADGVASRVRNFIAQRPTEILTGVGAELACRELDTGRVEIYVGNALAPGFFAWVIPLDDGHARIGLCAARDAFGHFKRFRRLLAKTHSQLKTAQALCQYAGAIPLGHHKLYADNVLLVGDAACQVKPCSGGGIYFGLTGAREAARVASHSLEFCDCSERVLSAYQQAWDETLGKEVKKGLWLRELYKDMTDEELDRLFAILEDEKILAIISEHGDMDFPSRLVRPLLKSGFGGLEDMLEGML